MQKRFVLLLSMLSVLVLVFITALHGAEWQTVRVEKGIKVQRVFVPGSPILRFKGSGIVQAPVVRILALLQDVEKQKRWNKNTYDNRIVQRISDTELIVYNAARTPWPFKDRDYLVRLKLDVDEKNRRIVVSGRETTHPDVPERDDRLRVPLIRTRWFFKPLKDAGGKKTHVEFSMHADPGGNMPNWLINYISKFIPYKSIQNIRREVARGGLDPRFLRKFQRYENWH